jgi:transcriptional regulator with XRE-family HTH domain
VTSDDPIVDRNKFLERLYDLTGTTQQKALAQIANLTSASMCRIQQGQSFPSVETLSRLAMVLNVSIDYLVGITDDPTPASRSAAAMKSALETPIDRAPGRPTPPRRSAKKK